MNLRIETCKGNIQIAIRSNQILVKDLKDILNTKGFSSLRNSIHFDGNRLLTYRTLSSYGIKHNSLVSVEFNEQQQFDVFLQFPDSKRTEYRLFPEHTIKEIKNCVECLGPQRFKSYMIDITFNDHILNDNGTLRDYDIDHGSLIKVVLKCHSSRFFTRIGYAFDDFINFFGV